MQNQRGFMNLVLIGVIFALVVIGGYFTLSKKSEIITQQPTQTPVVAQADTSTQVSKYETASWKTYKNTQYGFEFSYPPIYTVKSYSESMNLNFGKLFQVILNSKKIGHGHQGHGPLYYVDVSVWNNPNQLSLADWIFDKGEYGDDYSFSDVLEAYFYNFQDGINNSHDYKNENLSSHKAISYSVEELYYGYWKTVLIENDKEVVTFITNSDYQSKEGFQALDQILSTFKFTK